MTANAARTGGSFLTRFARGFAAWLCAAGLAGLIAWLLFDVDPFNAFILPLLSAVIFGLMKALLPVQGQDTGRA